MLQFFFMLSFSSKRLFSIIMMFGMSGSVENRHSNIQFSTQYAATHLVQFHLTFTHTYTHSLFAAQRVQSHIFSLYYTFYL